MQLRSSKGRSRNCLSVVRFYSARASNRDLATLQRVRLSTFLNSNGETSEDLEFAVARALECSSGHLERRDQEQLAEHASRLLLTSREAEAPPVRHLILQLLLETVAHPHQGFSMVPTLIRTLLGPLTCRSLRIAISLGKLQKSSMPTHGISQSNACAACLCSGNWSSPS